MANETEPDHHARCADSHIGPKQPGLVRFVEASFVKSSAFVPMVRHTYSAEEGPDMKVWIDQDLCTGDGLCEEIAPDVFTLLDDGLAYVKEGDKIFATAKGNPQGADGMANFPDSKLDAVIESAEECPGECIFIEP
jgi:ferredoxin